MSDRNSTPKTLPELGLVCITTSQQVRFKTLTRKRLLQMTVTEQEQALRHLYGENLRRLAAAVQYCETEGLHLYRLISGLFPFADEPVGAGVLVEFTDGLKQVGDRAAFANLRLVLHPDQFVVLNSDRPEVIENSLKILRTHAWIFDLMGLPQSPWALMNIHGGKGDRAERLIQVIRDLPDNIRQRLTLENDEHTYSAQKILEICQATQIPMVFDAHHHVIHEQLDSYEHPSVAAMVQAARSTWQPPEWQLVHISNGSEFFNDPHHSDLITLMPSAYRQVDWIEIEAKHKELAIAKLRQEWLPSLHITPSASTLEYHPCISTPQA
jgi:UV DNA damage endonuclease